MKISLIRLKKKILAQFSIWIFSLKRLFQLDDFPYDWFAWNNISFNFKLKFRWNQKLRLRANWIHYFRSAFVFSVLQFSRENKTRKKKNTVYLHWCVDLCVRRSCEAKEKKKKRKQIDDFNWKTKKSRNFFFYNFIAPHTKSTNKRNLENEFDKQLDDRSVNHEKRDNFLNIFVWCRFCPVLLRWQQTYDCHTHIVSIGTREERQT